MGNADAAPPLADAAEREIILTRLDENLAVEAAAGSGKTTCLVGRLLALARRGDIAPGRLLAAVTFTRKAAAELRDRWRVAIEREVAVTNGKERENLLAAERAIRLCHIGTIHAFASRLLRERPVEAGVDPDFRELEQEEDSILRNRAWDDLAARMHGGEFSGLAGDVLAGGLDLESLRELFLAFADYPDIPLWPGSDVPADLNDWEAFHAVLGEFGRNVDAFPGVPVEEAAGEVLYGLCRSLHAWAKRQGKPDSVSRYGLLRMADLLEGAPEACPKTWKGVFGKEFKTRLEEEKERYGRLYDEFAGPFLARLRSARYGAVMRCLFEARKRYDHLRRESGALNFQDLLMRAAALLRDYPRVRDDLARRYRRILVDEVQDTDPLQAEILFLLAGEYGSCETDWRRTRLRPGALFMVGDPKQSIYRFTRADIATYLELKRILSRNGGRTVRLSVNFRSQPAVVDWVNRTFEPSAAASALRFPKEDCRYSPAYAPLAAGRGAASPEAFGGVYRLDALPKVSARNKDGAPPRALKDVLRDEATRIARFIEYALEKPLLIDERGSGPRPARPGDFLVLTYGKSGVAEIANQMRLLGLPVRISGRNSFEPDSPLRLLLLAIKAALTPGDPVLQVAVLRSRLFGVADNELFAWKRAGRSFDRKEALPADVKGGIADAFSRLSAYRARLLAADPVAACRFAAEDLGVFPLAARDAGRPGMAAVGTVLDRLAVSAGRFRTAFETAEALETLLDSGEFDILPLEGVDAAAVRVMNLHKAKGLEAPVVFLAGSDSVRKHPPRVCIDRTGRLAAGFLALARGKRLLACPEGWEDREAEEERYLEYERLRLRYVAATRAGSAVVVTAHPASSGMKSAFVGEIAIDDPLPEPDLRVGAGEREVGEIALEEIEDGLSRIAGRVSAARQPSYRVMRAKDAVPSAKPMVRNAVTDDAGGAGPEWVGIRLSSEAAAALGEVAHALLADADALGAGSLKDRAARLLRLAELSADLADDVVGMVAAARRSAIWRRAAAAARQFRELPFTMTRDGVDGVREVVRGVIDLVFEENDGWVVVDYKTDRQAAGDARAQAERHRGQVETYARAVEGMLPRARVKETGILYLRTGEYVPLSAGDAY
ncbi:MAG: UvrD-helicase domain-containing protein [Planctomycetota bacterium]|jgi:ATP-dependent helicase/nuclease subunit A|nr:UvrD-helicase domain-containing protein [Planctomycetota bacterium]